MVVTSPQSEWSITIEVNGATVRRLVPARYLLSDFLRDDLRLTGTHVGCEHGVCGACTVTLDGMAVRSCLMFAVQADGHAVGTVEGLGPSNSLTPMQEEFHRHHALQCGFCTPGFLMTLNAEVPLAPPSYDDVCELLSGNLCRCTGYHGIVRAVESFYRGASVEDELAP